VLLNIFHLYRLADPDEYKDESGLFNFKWGRQRWWYKLAHVCRLWRNLILESPSGLDLHLFCTNGVPVADMLAHSPPLPLTICYDGDRVITAEDESGIFLALSHRDRVRHIDFWDLQNAGTLVKAMGDQFPSLERMYIHSPADEVVLPVTFQAPNLRHFRMMTASLSIQSPLLTTTAGLVTLMLRDIPSSSYFPPSHLLSQISLMLQLEILAIDFRPSPPNRDIEMQLHNWQTPDMTTFPNLHWFAFAGVSAYLEALVARISAPSFNTLQVYLFDRLSDTVPRLLQFMQTSKSLTFGAVQVTFGALVVSLHAVPWKWDTPLMLEIECGGLDWQVESAVQLFGTLSPILSVVEKVAFSYEEHDPSSEWHNIVDPSQWCELLMSFTNVKTIHVQDDLVSKIFPSLSSDDGGQPLELLPNLVEVGYSGRSDARDAVTTFIDERQVAGHPISLQLVDNSIFNEPWVL
jgi:hypothetical protein